MLTRVFVSSCAAVLCASGAASADWNASADFSATHNPNGAWSYGTRTTLEGVGLVPLSDQFTV